MYDINANNLDCEDPAMDVGAAPIPVDASEDGGVMYRHVSQSGMVTNAAGQPACYNGTDVTFQLTIPASTRIILNKSYVLVGVKFMNTGLTTAVDAATGVSLPWNTPAALIDTTDLLFNESSNITEQYMNSFGHSNMARTLTKYSRHELDNRDDLFFTPCIEETFDSSLILSKASIDRRKQWMTYGSTVEVTKKIPLADLFGSCDTPAAMLIKTMRLRIRFKNADDISFKVTGQTASDVLVTKCELHAFHLKLSSAQTNVESAKITGTSPLMRSSYSIFDPSPKTFSTGCSLIDPSVKNLQAVIVMIPVVGQTRVTAPAETYVNPYQYALAPNAGTTTTISSIQASYANVYAPMTPLDISTNTLANMRLYQQYLLMCKQTHQREVAPALTFKNFSNRIVSTGGGTATAATANMGAYQIVCLPFYSQTTYPKATYGGADLQTYFAGGTTGYTAVIVKVRAGFMEMRPDTSVYVMN